MFSYLNLSSIWWFYWCYFGIWPCLVPCFFCHFGFAYNCCLHIAWLLPEPTSLNTRPQVWIMSGICFPFFFFFLNRLHLHLPPAPYLTHDKHVSCRFVPAMCVCYMLQPRDFFLVSVLSLPCVINGFVHLFLISFLFLLRSHIGCFSALLRLVFCSSLQCFQLMPSFKSDYGSFFLDTA